ncbi:MAG: amidohydrolase family protein [Oscillospiraceae bacterium]|nr:amidohydrolase family protein [Oscillospiraceae bacterium]
MPELDIIIENGWIVDGAGNPRRRGDLGILGDRIAMLGDLRGVQARRRIDAEGAAVCPGFIDCHSHTDSTVEMNPLFESTIRQGVTTEVVGNCGGSKFMSDDGIASSTDKISPSDGKITPSADETTPSADEIAHALGKHLDYLDQKGMSANLAWLVGHNTIRNIAGVSGATVTDSQYDAMERLLLEAMNDGAIGLSTGLEFEPGRTCLPEEPLRLARLLKKYDSLYVSHIRNRDSAVLEALDEFLNVLETHGIRGQVSHMNIRHNTHAPDGAAAACAKRVADARARGVDVLADMTPLNYGIGQMAGILPQWLTSSPPDKMGGMLRDQVVRARLRSDCDRYWRFIAGGEWDRVRVQNCPALPQLNGMSFPEISALWSKDPWDCYFDILAASAPNIGGVVLVSYLFTDEHLKETISHPLYMLAVDGYSTSVDGAAAALTRFPLHYIGMAWFLTHHVRETGILTLEEAVRKMTSMPAGHFRLGARGLIAPGFIADICVFHPDRLETPFDIANPAQYTRGMDYVFVAGVPVLDKGEHTGALPGKNLRRLTMMQR